MIVPASVPAASSLGLHRSIPRRDVNTSSSRNDTSITNEENFNPDNLFEDVETRPRDSILDSDLDRLLGPLPGRDGSERAFEQECDREKKGPGNMIVICPRCLHKGFGIMGPHW